MNNLLNNSAGFIFSQRSVDMALVNKISGCPTTYPAPASNEIPVEPLYRRLESLR